MPPGAKSKRAFRFKNKPCFLVTMRWLWSSINWRDTAMAKGQVRSNKETRKPKKDKVADKAPPTLGSQVKNSESATKKK
jgi:hypothetical protein